MSIKHLILPLLLMMCISSMAQTRPFVRWWWNGDKVDTVELKRELHLLHDAGIGGVEINPIEFPSKRCDSLGIFPDYSEGGQLFWRATGKGQSITIRLDIPEDGRYDLLVRSSYAPDYGVLEILIDDQKVAQMDTFSAKIKLIETKEGTVDLTAGTHILTIVIADKARQSTGYYVGIDKLTFSKVG